MDDVVDLPEVFAVLLAAKVMMLALLAVLLVRMRRRTHWTFNQIRKLEGLVREKQERRRSPSIAAARTWPGALPDEATRFPIGASGASSDEGDARPRGRRPCKY